MLSVFIWRRPLTDRDRVAVNLRCFLENVPRLGFPTQQRNVWGSSLLSLCRSAHKPDARSKRMICLKKS